jgi:hypothetical protein
MMMPKLTWPLNGRSLIIRQIPNQRKDPGVIVGSLRKTISTSFRLCEYAPDGAYSAVLGMFIMVGLGAWMDDEMEFGSKNNR